MKVFQGKEQKGKGTMDQKEVEKKTGLNNISKLMGNFKIKKNLENSPPTNSIICLF